MNVQTLNLVIRIIEALCAVAKEAPELVQGAGDVISALKSGQPLTAEQLSRITVMLDRTHFRLQEPYADEEASRAE